MTIRRTVARVSMICLIPALALAQDTPDAAPGASVLQVQDAPDQIIHVNTRIRHTTVIQLPPRENILDFIVGDSEYWHLSGAANLAFLKPIGEGVKTNVALVCESGRIYSFLVVERDAPPHLIVRVGDDPTTTTPAGVPDPRLRRAVARGRVPAHGRGKPRGRPRGADRRRDADRRDAPGRDRADQRVSFELSHALGVSLSTRRQGRALALSGTRHVARRSVYVRPLDRQETPALYEHRDGDPSLIPYDLQQDGLLIVRRLVGSGWLQIGRDRAGWKIDLDDLD